MSDVLIDIGLSEEQKAALEAMLEGFEESAKGEGIKGASQNYKRTMLLKERHPDYRDRKYSV